MSTHRFDIETVAHDIRFEDFHRDYFLPERPVVIRGIGEKLRRVEDLSIGNIRAKIVEKGLATVNTYWFEGSAEMAALLVATPEIITRELEDSHCRKDHCRLWLNGFGNFTPSHYDGNMLYVFNLQLTGRKEWRIVSPHTPLRNYPLSRAALFNSESQWPAVNDSTVFSDFVLEEGDMIFLPPMWHHSVKATAESNVNINWVATRKSGHVDSKTLQRELELLKFALVQHKLTGRTQTLGLILGAGMKGYLENFAGVGWDFIESHTRSIKLHRLATRLLKELALSGYALKDSLKLRRQSKKQPLDSVKDAAPADPLKAPSPTR